MPHDVLIKDSKRGKWTASTRRSGNMLGMPANDTLEMIKRIESGFGFNALLRFQKMSGLPMAEIADVLQIPPRTLARRRATRRLHPQESERLLRLAALFEKAVALFEGDVAGARNWFTRPVRALGYQQPLNYARTEIGAREVEHVIGRLEDGVFT
jgi:putative toxin-antitoxin system antitoxin component (TIGR02293 family)